MCRLLLPLSYLRWSLVALALLALPACLFGEDGPGEVRERELSLPLEGATAARYVFAQDVGWLQLAGGADGLLDAELTYNERLDPNLTRAGSAKAPEVTLAQPATEGKGWDELPYRTSDNGWLVRLNRDVLADVELRSDTAKLDVDLATVPVRSLTATGRGRAMTIGLDGEQPDLERVQIDTTVSGVWLNMEGRYSDVETIAVESTTGQVTLVMLGDWERDTTATVSTTSGDIALHLPEDIGVAVRPAPTSGEFHQLGFHLDGELWVNDAYGSASVTLTLVVATESGDIAFRTEPET